LTPLRRREQSEYAYNYCDTPHRDGRASRFGYAASSSPLFAQLRSAPIAAYRTHVGAPGACAKLSARLVRSVRELVPRKLARKILDANRLALADRADLEMIARARTLRSKHSLCPVSFQAWLRTAARNDSSLENVSADVALDLARRASIFSGEGLMKRSYITI
jgi:hypothetical protein